MNLSHKMLDFVEPYAKQARLRGDAIVAKAIVRFRPSRRLKQGYLEDREEARAFADSALHLFLEVTDEPP